jgi:2-polyprenyl-6-methoxyphenol hydroxylase-like FAD-dependent oxidoreductase
MEVLVVGAGIAGLSFALKATRLGGRVKVLERGGIDRKATYGHSLSIRTDVRVVQALQDLGLLDTLQQMTTPTQGFFIATMPDTVVL